jgi:putative two-component system response regulator
MSLRPPSSVRILIDVFDALTSNRPYRSARTPEEAVEIMRQGRGAHFDGDLLDLFLASLDDVAEIYGNDQPDHHLTLRRSA